MVNVQHFMMKIANIIIRLFSIWTEVTVFMGPTVRHPFSKLPTCSLQAQSKIFKLIYSFNARFKKVILTA